MKNVAVHLSNLKSKVNKLGDDQLVPVSVDLSNTCDVVKNGIIKKDAYNASNEVKNKIPDITNSATTNALTTVENKISNVRNLVKKADYNTKTNEIEKKTTINHDHDKYSTTQEFIKLTWATFNARLVQANLASKSDVANFLKETHFDNKLEKLNENITSTKQDIYLFKMI